MNKEDVYLAWCSWDTFVDNMRLLITHLEDRKRGVSR